jgi:hypothetical protein
MLRPFKSIQLNYPFIFKSIPSNSLINLKNNPYIDINKILSTNPNSNTIVMSKTARNNALLGISLSYVILFIYLFRSKK